MPDPCIPCEICAPAAAIWARVVAGDTVAAPWDDADEARMSQIAESFDADTSTYRPLAPREIA